MAKESIETMPFAPTKEGQRGIVVTQCLNGLLELGKLLRAGGVDSVLLETVCQGAIRDQESWDIKKRGGRISQALLDEVSGVLGGKKIDRRGDSTLALLGVTRFVQIALSPEFEGFPYQDKIRETLKGVSVRAIVSSVKAMAEEKRIPISGSVVELNLAVFRQFNLLLSEGED